MAKRPRKLSMQERIQLEEFWRSRALWLSNSDDKSLMYRLLLQQQRAGVPVPQAKPEPTKPRQKKPAAAGRAGRPPKYDIPAIRAAAEKYIRDVGLPDTFELFWEKIDGYLSEQHIHHHRPTQLKVLLRPIYQAAKAKT